MPDARSSTARLAGWFGVARVPFLALPLALVANGAAAQAWAGTFSWPRTLLALAGLVAMHVAVNALNEASDFESGIDLVTQRTPFSGGSGAIPGRLIGTRAARRLGWTALLVGVLVGVWFVARDGLALVPVLVVGLLLVTGYSTGFARLGLGEVAAGLGLGLLPVLGTAIAQGAPASDAAWAAAFPAFFLTFDLLLLNEFPDEAADRAGRRRNLVLMLGRPHAARLYLVAALAVPAAILFGVGLGAMPRSCLLGLVPSILLAGPGRWALADPEGPVPVRALAANVLWNLGTNALLAVGFLLG